MTLLTKLTLGAVAAVSLCGTSAQADEYHRWHHHRHHHDVVVVERPHHRHHYHHDVVVERPYHHHYHHRHSGATVVIDR